MSEMRSLEDWKAAIRRSYLASVTEEEYDAKAADDAVSRVAQYFRESGYDIELFDDTSDESPNREVQFLFDFLAFTGRPTNELALMSGSVLKIVDHGDEVLLMFDRTKVVSLLELNAVTNDRSIEPYVHMTLNVGHGTHEPCIHPNLFANGPVFDADGVEQTEHCWTCGQDVPRHEL